MTNWLFCGISSSPHASPAFRARPSPAVAALALAALLLLPPTGGAQDCNSETGGATLSGLLCDDVNAAVLEGNPSGSGADNVRIGQMILDALPSIGSNDSTLPLLFGSNGTAHLPSGEFRARLDLVRLGGIARGAQQVVGATFRSSLVGGLDYDPTGGQWPFGEGWAASFAEGLLVGATAGSAVDFVDRLGAKWSFTSPSSETEPSGPLAGTWWTYPAENGSRLVAWVSGSVTTWYREFPDRTRNTSRSRTRPPALATASSASFVARTSQAPTGKFPTATMASAWSRSPTASDTRSHFRGRRRRATSGASSTSTSAGRRR